MSDLREAIRAGHVVVTFEALEAALKLPEGVHVVAVREIGRETGDWPPRSIDIALIGGTLPELQEGERWPLINIDTWTSE